MKKGKIDQIIEKVAEFFINFFSSKGFLMALAGMFIVISLINIFN